MVNGIKGPYFWTLDMLDHSHLFEAPSTRLGSDLTQSTESKTPDIYTIAIFCFLALLFCALSVVACIAVAHSNNDLLNFHCGRTLGHFVIVDIIVGFIGLFVWGFVLFFLSNDMGDMVSNLYGFLGMLSLFLCVATSILSDYALTHSECMSAMRSIGEDEYSSLKGFDSPSANTGLALLAVSGVCYGVIYAILTAWFFYSLFVNAHKKSKTHIRPTTNQ